MAARDQISPKDESPAKAGAAPSLADIGRRALAVLDMADVTQYVYHDAVYNLPLVAHILKQVVDNVAPDGRLLVIGGNPLLTLTLVAEGYDCDIYTLAGEPLPAAVQAHVRGALRLDSLAAGSLPSTSGGYHAVLMPFALDALHEDPRRLLSALRTALCPGGRAILVGTNLAKIGSRWRALRGRDYLPSWSDPPRQRAGGWPILPEHRHYTPAEVRTLGEEAFLGGRGHMLTSGYRAFNWGIPMKASRWLAALGKRAIKDLRPAWREFWVVSFTNWGARPGWSHAVPATLSSRDDDTVAKAQPFVSVILPTHNRSAMLRDCLENGLYRQTYQADSWELILIDDGSTDDTQQVMDELVPHCPAHVRRFKLEGVGAAAARNFGMRQARGPIVAHLDDDGRPLPNWLEAGIAAFGPGVAIVCGPIRPAPEQPIGFFTFISRMEEDRGLYPTSNVFYLLDPVMGEGLFDESFGNSLLGRPMLGWDSDLAWKMKRKGYRSVFTPYAVMLSFTFDLGLKRWLQESRKAQMLPAVIRRVPETRCGIFRIAGIIEGLDHLAWLFSLVGLILASILRRPEPLLLLLPYLICLGWQFRHDVRRPGRWPRLGAKYGLRWLLHLLYFFWLMLGAIRARRFVL